MADSRNLRVFLCHASQDKPVVRELYQRLHAEKWIDPWLDEEKLLPGQDWDMEIEKAVEVADTVIVCLSNNSISKEGYIQRELKFVLDLALEKPEGTIFVIPLRLDDCQIPRRLRSFHYVDYFPATNKGVAYKRLLSSLDSRWNNSLEISKKAAPVLHIRSSVTEEPPVSETIFDYSFGQDGFDESFEIKTSKNNFLGEYGMGVSELASSGVPQKVIAFELWLFDILDVKTSTTVITNSYTLKDPAIAKKLNMKGQIVNVEQQNGIVVATERLIMEVNISDIKLIENRFTNALFFDHIKATVKIWTK